jgi:hypothetical protein
MTAIACMASVSNGAMHNLSVNPALYHCVTRPRVRGACITSLIPATCLFPAAIACCPSVSRPHSYVTKEYSERGKYTIRLFDGLEGKWKRVTIDDKIPTHDNKPIFAKPNDRELWCLLMEKAMAKVNESACKHRGRTWLG